MALTIPPVTPISTVAPVNSASTPPVFPPVPGQSGTGEFLEQNLLNSLTNTDNNIVPLPGTTDTGDFLEQNLVGELNARNMADNTEAEELISNVNRMDGTVFFNSRRMNRINNLPDFVNDNSPIIEADTRLPLESVVILQEPAPVAQNAFVLNTKFSSSMDIYSYIIGALQGGANGASPTRELENRTEFEV